MIYFSNLHLVPRRHLKQELKLAHNEFEDDDDWLGFISDEIEAQEFLTVVEHVESETVITEFDQQGHSVLKFPKSAQVAP